MLCRSVYAHGLAAGQKTVENQDWATGPRSRGAPGPPGRGGPWAAGRRAVGPSGRWAVAGRGPRAAGPLGRGGPWAAGRWAAGLLLAKPLICGYIAPAYRTETKILY